MSRLHVLGAVQYLFLLVFVTSIHLLFLLVIMSLDLSVRSRTQTHCAICEYELGEYFE